MNGNIAVTGTVTGAIAGHSIGKAPPMPSSIVFCSVESGGEMLRIAHDGVYVRGEKIPQDDAEARKVYDTFVSWLRTTGHNA